MIEENTTFWKELDPRTTATTAVRTTGVATAAGVPTAAGIASEGSIGTALLWVLPSAALLIVAVTALGELRRRHTRYRVTPDVVEFENGIFLRRRRVVHRDRIRVVDVTADPVARTFGLAKVVVGTGEQAGERTVTLKFVSSAVGERLRGRLLGRPLTGSRDSLVAQLDPSWVRYAPLSFVTPFLGFAAAGGVMQVADWFGLAPHVVGWVGDLFEGVPVLVMILVLLAVSQVVGVVGSLGLFVEQWWHYSLEREPGGTLRVQRGLFTTRSISLEESRLRGVEIVEPLGARIAGAARVDAVATGMKNSGADDESDHRILLPAAPRDMALRVSTEVLREPGLWSESAVLIPHPVAARRRRLCWSLLAVSALVSLPALLGLLLTDVLLHISWVTALVSAPAAVLLALDAYRSLGHAVTGDYLFVRSGTVRRGTVVLQRRGIIGWTVKQSIFQRRAGLVTIAVTTAAGTGAYRIVDVGEIEGLLFAEAVRPDLFAPFLEGHESLPTSPGTPVGSRIVGATSATGPIVDGTTPAASPLSSRGTSSV